MPVRVQPRYFRLVYVSTCDDSLMTTSATSPMKMMCIPQALLQPQPAVEYENRLFQVRAPGGACRMIHTVLVVGNTQCHKSPIVGEGGLFFTKLCIATERRIKSRFAGSPKYSSRFTFAPRVLWHTQRCKLLTLTQATII